MKYFSDFNYVWIEVRRRLGVGSARQKYLLIESVPTPLSVDDYCLVPSYQSGAAIANAGELQY